MTYDGSTTLDSASANIIVATNSAVTIAVDAQLNRHAISPLIYGVAFASAAELSDLNAPLNRSGGNAETRYNWQIDAHNRGNDWYFISIGDGPGTPGPERRRLRYRQPERGRRADADDPHDRLDAQTGLRPGQAGQLLRQPNTAPRPRRSPGGRTSATASAYNRPHSWPITYERSERRQLRHQLHLPGGLAAAPDQPLGSVHQRRRALLLHG